MDNNTKTNVDIDYRKEDITMTNQDTMMTQTTFENTYNQFTPKVFSNPIIGKLTVLIDQSEQLWFIGSEVARGLGYSDTWDAINKHVSVYNKLKYNGKLETGESPVSSWGGSRSTILISEQGLYQLIGQSQLDNPQVEEFKKWMFKTIQDMRQYGVAMSHQMQESFGMGPQQLYQQLQHENNQLKQELYNAQPAINLYNEVANDTYNIPISVIASNYGLSAQALNTILHRLGFHYPCGGGWVLYDPYRSMGLAKTRTRQTPEGIYEFVIGYNEKGRIMIDKLLHDNNLLTEQERMLEQARLMQLKPQTVQQPQTIYNNYYNNYYYGNQPPQAPKTHIGQDGREYDEQGRLIVMTDKEGRPLV